MLRRLKLSVAAAKKPEMANPATGQPVHPRFLGEAARTEANRDRRLALAQWLAELRWSTDNEQGRRLHVTFVELAVDFEVTTGMSIPLHARRRGGDECECESWRQCERQQQQCQWRGMWQ